MSAVGSQRGSRQAVEAEVLTSEVARAGLLGACRRSHGRRDLLRRRGLAL